MAATFPNLTGPPSGPDVLEFTDRVSTNPTIRSPKDAGYVQTRARFTRYTRQCHIVYTGLKTTDKNTILAHEEERGIGSSSFNWTNPADAVVYIVRFLAPIIYSEWEQTNYNRWVVSFDLEEV